MNKTEELTQHMPAVIDLAEKMPAGNRRARAILLRALVGCYVEAIDKADGHWAEEDDEVTDGLRSG